MADDEGGGETAAKVAQTFTLSAKIADMKPQMVTDAKRITVVSEPPGRAPRLPPPRTPALRGSPRSRMRAGWRARTPGSRPGISGGRRRG